MKIAINAANQPQFQVPEKLIAMGLCDNYEVDKADYYDVKDIVIRLLANGLSFDVANISGEILFWVYQGE